MSKEVFGISERQIVTQRFANWNQVWQEFQQIYRFLNPGSILVPNLIPLGY